MKKNIFFLLFFSFVSPLFAQTFQNTAGGQLHDHGPEICFPVLVSGLPTVIDSNFGISSVCLNISHVFDASLRIKLKSPDGNIVTLSNQNGSDMDNYISTCFTESDSVLITNGSAPFTGGFVPEESINKLNNGQNPNGIWYLCVNDLMIGDSGFVHDFSLQFEVNPPKDKPYSFFPCSIFNPLACQCQNDTVFDCNLLPDITTSALLIKSQHTEYPGKIRLSVGTPNIGWGPLEIRGADTCYCDTVRVSCNTSLCPDGTNPKQMVMQRIYHKNQGSMSSFERSAGTMSFHPSHGHIHVDNWINMTVREPNGSPNPLSWPILGSGTKLSFCLINLGDCTHDYGFCVNNNNDIITMDSIPNAPFGLVSGCDTMQGIFVGKMDIYDQSLPDMEILIPGVCNGNYYIVCQVDPTNVMLESDENNNIVAVPITLKLQNDKPDASISFNIQGNNVQFTAINLPHQTYQWDFGDATHDSILNPLHHFTADGNYIVKLIVTNACGTDTSTILVPFISTFSGNYDLDFSNVSISPNPWKEQTVISYTVHSKTWVSLEIFDLLGRKVKQWEEALKSPGKQQLQLTDLSAGVYLFRIQSKDGFRMMKMIKVHE